MSEHTPLPWHVNYSKISRAHVNIVTGNCKQHVWGCCIAPMHQHGTEPHGFETDLANAEYIATACNAYKDDQKLIALLEEIVADYTLDYVKEEDGEIISKCVECGEITDNQNRGHVDCRIGNALAKGIQND